MKVADIQTANGLIHNLESLKAQLAAAEGEVTVMFGGGAYQVNLKSKMMDLIRDAIRTVMQEQIAALEAKLKEMGVEV